MSVCNHGNARGCAECKAEWNEALLHIPEKRKKRRTKKKGALCPPHKDKEDRKHRLFRAVQVELDLAMGSFPPFNSLHEAFSVMNEEVDELWAEVKKKQGLAARPIMARKEAIQVAAMALRLILDCCEREGEGYGK